MDAIWDHPKKKYNFIFFQFWSCDSEIVPVQLNMYNILWGRSFYYSSLAEGIIKFTSLLLMDITLSMDTCLILGLIGQELFLI